MFEKWICKCFGHKISHENRVENKNVKVLPGEGMNGAIEGAVTVIADKHTTDTDLCERCGEVHTVTQVQKGVRETIYCAFELNTHPPHVKAVDLVCKKHGKRYIKLDGFFPYFSTNSKCPDC